jgi:hypothetical protein
MLKMRSCVLCAWDLDIVMRAALFAARFTRERDTLATLKVGAEAKRKRILLLSQGLSKSKCWPRINKKARSSSQKKITIQKINIYIFFIYSTEV